MQNSNMRLPSILDTKREAKKLRKNNSSIKTHGEALTLIANRHGFSNWKIMKVAIKKQEDKIILPILKRLTFPDARKNIEWALNEEGLIDFPLDEKSRNGWEKRTDVEKYIILYSLPFFLRPKYVERYIGGNINEVLSSLLSSIMRGLGGQEIKEEDDGLGDFFLDEETFYEQQNIVSSFLENESTHLIYRHYQSRYGDEAENRFVQQEQDMYRVYCGGENPPTKETVFAFEKKVGYNLLYSTKYPIK